MRERVRWVLLTHTHPDHSPATAALVKATGAEVLAFTKREPDLKVDRTITDGDTIDGTEFRLEVLHTPGHAPNHLCFFLDEERILFTGDTILDGMYSVVSPKTGGDMAQVPRDARAAARRCGSSKIAPGHGDVIEEPRARIDEYLQHRLAREKQILGILKKGPAKIREIVAALYPDIAEPLVDVAGKQVHAHLLKLRAEGKVAGRARSRPGSSPERPSLTGRGRREELADRPVLTAMLPVKDGRSADDREHERDDHRDRAHDRHVRLTMFAVGAPAGR